MAYPATATFPASITRPSTANHELNVIVFDGDSMNLGTTAGSAYALHTLLATESAYTGKAQFFNVAVGGTSVTTQTAAFAQTNAYKTKYGHGYLFHWGGTAGFTASTFTELQAYWAQARAAGWKVVANTLTPQSADGAPEVALRDACNASIRAATTEWDYLVDIAALLSDGGDLTYYSDGVHLTAAGYVEVASYINTNILLPIL